MRRTMEFIGRKQLKKLTKANCKTLLNQKFLSWKHRTQTANFILQMTKQIWLYVSKQSYSII